MKNKTIKIIHGKDEQELVDKINKDESDFFATQIKQKIDGTWVSFCYSIKFQPKSNSTEEGATKAQKNYIYKNNLSVNTENLTKREAFAIIKADKEKKKKVGENSGVVKEQEIKEEDYL